MIGSGKKADILYLIDFGLAKRFINPKTGQHIEFKRKAFATGTMRYCSAESQKAYEQGRRDDLISIGNILVYFCSGGDLPWIDLSEGKQIESKLNFRVDKYLDGKTGSIPIIEFYRKVKKLRFDENPDYESLK